MSCSRLSIITAAALATLTLSSCGISKWTSEGSDFVFDTYASYSLHGSGGCNITASEISDSLKQLSEAFQLCYDTPAAELPENSDISDCYDKVCALNEKYGGGINVTCGALTRLWGISTDTPHVPADEEITAALDTVANGYTDEFAEGTYLDFGAVAKGYACDNEYAHIERNGGIDIDYAVLSMGSSTLLYGDKKDGKFRAGITNPDKAEGYLGIIETDAAFISTSGGYERYFEADGKRYSHILDMETGRPVETDLVSVTVIVPADTENGGIMSDFLSTLIYIQGTEQLDKWLAYEEFEVVAADENGVVYTDCDGFTLDGGSGYSYGK